MKKLLSISDTRIILIGSILHGLLSTLSLAPFNFPLLAWIAPWPLFYFARRYQSSNKKLLISGAVSSFFLCLFSFYWMLHTFQEFGGMNIGFALLIFIPYTILLNLKSPLFVWLLGICFRRRLNLFPLVGGVALLTEYLAPQIFHWYWGNLIGGNPWLSQWAEVVGVSGLTLIHFIGSYFLYRLAQLLSRVDWNGAGLRRLKRRFILKRLLPIPFIFLVALLVGGFRKHQIEEQQKSLPTLRVAMIQPFSPLEKPGKRFITLSLLRDIMLKTIPEMVEEAFRKSGGGIELIVLPESAVPYLSAELTPQTLKLGLYSPDLDNMAQLLSYNYNSALYFNESTIREGTDLLGNRSGLAYNSSVLYSPEGSRHDTYQKRILLAFGEYIPGLELMKKTGLINLVPGIVRGARFYPGETSNNLAYFRRAATDNSEPLPFPEPSEVLKKSPAEVRAGFAERSVKPEGYFMPLICYEVLFPEHSRSFFQGKQQPEFMVNITQDGWYGDTVETYQHYELGRIRSIETRRALVRSTNNGVSGFIDQAGNYVKPLVGPALTDYDTRDIQVWDVPLQRDLITFYVRYGDSWILLLLLFFSYKLTRRTLHRRRSK